MSCPFCKSKVYQQYMGNLGGTPYYRCGSCGMQYGGAEPSVQYSMNAKKAAPVKPRGYEDMVNVTGKGIISRSEWGSFTYDGTADMKVLKSRAIGAVKYFNKEKPIKEMETHIFGYPFSIIDNGKLSDNERARYGNVIIRCLTYREKGVYAGHVTLTYDDDYNDGRGQGGSGAIIIDDVTDVYIDGDYLVISGYDGPQKRPVTYRYTIQDKPDTKPFVHPIPKKKGQSHSEDDVEEEPEPKKAAPKKKEPKKETKPKGKTDIFEDGDVEGLWKFTRPDGLYGTINYDIHQPTSDRYVVDIRHKNGLTASKGFFATLDDAKDFAKNYKVESRFNKQSKTAVYEQEDYGVWSYHRNDGVKGQIIERSVPGSKNVYQISGLPTGSATCGSLEEAKSIIEEKTLEAKPTVSKEDPRFKIPVGTSVKKIKDGQWSYDKPDMTFHADIYYLKDKDKFSLVWCYPDDGYKAHDAQAQSVSDAYERIKKEIDARDAKYPEEAPKKEVKKTEKKGLSKHVSKKVSKSKKDAGSKKHPKVVQVPSQVPSKPKKETKKAAKSIPTKGGMEYQVRVDGSTIGSFSSKAKAQAMVKELKGQGKKPKIYTVFT